MGEQRESASFIFNALGHRQSLAMIRFFLSLKENARKEALEDQCVSSPDKLEAEVKSLKKAVRDAEEEAKSVWKESGKITDDVERMKQSVATGEVATDAVRRAGTVLKQAA